MLQNVRQEAEQTAQGGAVSIEAVTKWFGTYHALDTVSLNIRSNEFFTLLGPSGCGKTTLLRMIAGFESPSDGRILLDGMPISSFPPYERPINTVFQSYALFPHMTVAQNVGFGLKMQRRAAAEIAETVKDMLRLVQLDHLAERKVAQLSGGQQQRVALARALAPRPKVLLLDEPLSALDLKLRQAMQIELKRLRRELGITFVFVTHDQEEALTMSDRIAVMSAGQLLQVGSPEEIYERPINRFVADFIGETNFIDGELDATGTVFVTTSGARLRVVSQGKSMTGAATLAVRPEQLHLTQSTTQNALSGRVESVVYFGTDSHVHVQCAGEVKLVVRTQNSRGGVNGLREGQPVFVEVPSDKLRILKG